jgi:hypothetical protein
LTPKKSRSFIESTAKELKLNPNLVEHVVDYYWKGIRKSLVELKSPIIQVRSIGEFRLKVWDLEEQRRRYQLHLDSGDPNKMSFAKHQIRKDVEERLKNLNKVMEITSADKERKEKLKNKKTNGSIIKRNLESPDANS